VPRAARMKRRTIAAAWLWLICIECGEKSENGEGWKGELAVDLLDEEEPDEVAVYCPECWSREFGDE